LEKDKIIEFVKNMDLREHVVLLYINPEDKRDCLFTYLKAGLDRGQAVAYVTSQESTEDIKKAMVKFDIDVERCEQSGALRVIDYRDWYMIGGDFDISKTMGLWRKLLEASKTKGFKGLRVTGEMACFFERDMVDKLMEYEHTLHRVLDLPMMAICAYDVTLFTKKEWFNVLIELLNTHSTTIMLGQKGLGVVRPNEILVKVAL
jgi:hypothetical protein